MIHLWGLKDGLIMKKLTLLKIQLLAFIFSFLCASTPAYADLSTCTRLVVTGNAEYPPILWRDPNHPGKLIGVAVELLELSLMGTGIKVDARNRGVWARAQKEAKYGEIDMLAGAFITEQRQKYMDYIFPPFTNVPSVVWVVKGKEFEFNKWDDLGHKRGGTLLNNSFGQDFDQYAAKNLDIVSSATAERSFSMLIAERFDYVLYELYQGLTILEVSGLKDSVGYLKTPISVEGLYFTFSKKSGCNTQALRKYLGGRVKQLSDSKTFERLFDKYMQVWLESQK